MSERVWRCSHGQGNGDWVYIGGIFCEGSEEEMSSQGSVEMLGVDGVHVFGLDGVEVFGMGGVEALTLMKSIFSPTR